MIDITNFSNAERIDFYSDTESTNTITVDYYKDTEVYDLTFGDKWETISFVLPKKEFIDLIETLFQKFLWEG